MCAPIASDTRRPLSANSRAADLESAEDTQSTRMTFSAR